MTSVQPVKDTEYRSYIFFLLFFTFFLSPCDKFPSAVWYAGRHFICTVAQSCKFSVRADAGLARIFIVLSFENDYIPLWFYNGSRERRRILFISDSIGRGFASRLENRRLPPACFPSKFALSSPLPYLLSSPPLFVCTLISCSVEHRDFEGNQLSYSIRGREILLKSLGENLSPRCIIYNDVFTCKRTIRRTYVSGTGSRVADRPF